MSIVARLHDRIYRRRVRVLCDCLAPLFPRNSLVLDVGCGDGLLDSHIARSRADTRIEGIDVLPREQTYVPVVLFDGRVIPHADASFDAVLLVDILHHAEDPMALLRECVRVSRGPLIIKDHTRDGFLADPTLRFMDWIGNARHGVSLPYNYWPRSRWREAFESLGLRVDIWRSDLGIYPQPAGAIFGRSLHFVARLGLRDQKGSPSSHLGGGTREAS